MAIISIIVAMGRNNVIGINNSLPWRIPADLKYFKEVTLGKSVIMGQKTFESIGKPLKDRKNIILTFDKSFKGKDLIVVHSIEEAIKKTEKEQEIIIAGGASVYKQFLPLADKMYITLIDSDFDGDVFFPNFNKFNWLEIQRKERKSDGYNYAFLILEKKK